MDGVEEERRGSQGKRNSNVGGRGEDIHGDGEPLLERLLPHQRRAIASALLFLKAAAISPARATKAQLLRFLLFFFLSLSFFSSFFSLPLSSFILLLLIFIVTGKTRLLLLLLPRFLSPPLSFSVFFPPILFLFLPFLYSFFSLSLLSFFCSSPLVLSQVFVMQWTEGAVCASANTVWPFRVRWWIGRRTAVF